MKKNFKERVDKAALSIRQKTEATPTVGLILGSGLSSVSDSIEGLEIPYDEIDEMPVISVTGHKGSMKIGEMAITFAGRTHFYEGGESDDIVFSVALMKKLGVKTLIVTNACGAVNRDYKPGEIILLKDHINNMGFNPLIGPNSQDLGDRFPDMSDVYSKSLRTLVHETVKKIDPDFELKEGVYMAYNGPSYETPAEIKMAGIVGADLVGMSTVPEAIVANYLGMNVIGLSCVTNMAAGILDQPLNHKEVIEVGKTVQKRMVELINKILEVI